ncbi:MAG: universal stress protein [Saprospiraceae bacterium]|nr:universal stress protein [Bacteroidota bacterium]MCB9313977.1 universal stress protein [Lewinellaceae bacterium]
MLRILLPTDFSPPALNAFRYATNLATLINGRIDLVHVHLPEMLGGSMLSLKDIKDTERGVRNRFLERLESFSGQTDKKIVFGHRVAFHESVAGGIVETASELDPQLIVMGLKNTHNLFEKLFGSITSDVIAKSPIPLLVIPENVAFENAEKLVFATNFEKGEEEIWGKLDKWADMLGVEVEVVHIGKESGRSVASGEAEKFYDKHGGVHFVEAPTVLEGLNGYLMERPASVLALFKPRRGFFEKLVKTSHSRSILFEANMPVLVLTKTLKAF